MSTVMIPADAWRQRTSDRRPAGQEWPAGPAQWFAMVGVVIGLGSAWRLPALLDRHGGGAFLLVYLSIMLLVGLPVLMAELMIGRRGRTCPTCCYGLIAHQEGRHGRWRWVASIGGLAGLLVLAAGSQILAQAGLLGTRLGWTALGGDPDLLLAGRLLYHRPAIMLIQLAFFALLGLVTASGRVTRTRTHVAVGLIAVILLVGLAVNALWFHRTPVAVYDLLRPEFTRVGWVGVLEAARLALLTLGLTFGTVMAQGAGLPAGASILGASIRLLAVAATTVIIFLLLVSSVLHPLRMSPLTEQSLVVGQMPAALQPLPWNGVVLAAWYWAVVLGGVAGGLTVLQVVVTQLEVVYRIGRGRSAVIAAGLSWCLGALALGLGPRWGLLEVLRSVSVDLLLPASALGVALFAGWAMSRRASRSELGLTRSSAFRLWRVLIRHLAPAILGSVLIAGAIELIAGS